MLSWGRVEELRSFWNGLRWQYHQRTCQGSREGDIVGVEDGASRDSSHHGVRRADCKVVG